VRFLLKHRNDLGGIECASLKLETYQASIALYRSITEKHAFYSCETVRSAVTSQFVRDLKGTIASFFNENTDLGSPDKLPIFKMADLLMPTVVLLLSCRKKIYL
jgi:E3 ubiquitin-protein ligase MYLIP